MLGKIHLAGHEKQGMCLEVVTTCGSVTAE